MAVRPWNPPEPECSSVLMASPAVTARATGQLRRMAPTYAAITKPARATDVHAGSEAVSAATPAPPASTHQGADAPHHVTKAANAAVNTTSAGAHAVGWAPANAAATPAARLIAATTHASTEVIRMRRAREGLLSEVAMGRGSAASAAAAPASSWGARRSRKSRPKRNRRSSAGPVGTHGPARRRFSPSRTVSRRSC